MTQCYLPKITEYDTELSTEETQYDTVLYTEDSSMTVLSTELTVRHSVNY